MDIVSRTSATEYEALVGRTVDAIFQDGGYWHLVVALRCQDGNTISFNTEAVEIANYFEVFPIKVEIEQTEQRPWQLLNEPRTIVAVDLLLREEWLEHTIPHPRHVGSPPHYAQRAGRGPAPDQALEHVVVQAGFQLRFDEGMPIVVFASSTAPFNVEIALQSTAIESALAAFNPTEA